MPAPDGRHPPPASLPAAPALRPPMGWNSWNCFGVDVREHEVLAAAEHLAGGLRPHGWEYVVVDAGWYLAPGITTANFKQPRPAQHLDAFGRLLPAPHKFPSAAGGRGFRPLADRIHALGLKFGLHLMRGLPWQAAEGDLPVWNSPLRAAAIADPRDVCPWFHGNVGLRADGGGALAYYRSLVALYADWGVDFLKADDMSFPYHREEIVALAQAVRESPRPMLLSLSPGPAPVGEAAHLRAHANLWRISPDFWDDWRLLRRQFELCRAWQGRGAPGAWPDCDMLPLGRLRLTGPDDYSVGEMGVAAEELTDEFSRFSPDEKIALWTLWCVFRSPLFLGGYLPRNDDFTARLVSHAETLALNQRGEDNREVYFDDTASVWTTRDPLTGARYLAVFNLADPGETPRHAPRWRDLGVERACGAHEIWTDRRETLAPDAVATSAVPPHGARLYRLPAG